MALVRFSSTAAGEIFMFEDSARALFEIIGKDATPEGIITAAQVPAALERLKAAVDEEKRRAAEPPPAKPGAGRDDDEEERAAEAARQHVRLGQRAFPVIEMLERARAKNADVLWGV